MYGCLDGATIARLVVSAARGTFEVDAQTESCLRQAVSSPALNAFLVEYPAGVPRNDRESEEPDFLVAIRRCHYHELLSQAIRSQHGYQMSPESVACIRDTLPAADLNAPEFQAVEHCLQGEYVELYIKDLDSYRAGAPDDATAACIRERIKDVSVETLAAAIADSNYAAGVQEARGDIIELTLPCQIINIHVSSYDDRLEWFGHPGLNDESRECLRTAAERLGADRLVSSMFSPDDSDLDDPDLAEFNVNTYDCLRDTLIDFFADALSAGDEPRDAEMDACARLRLDRAESVLLTSALLTVDGTGGRIDPREAVDKLDLDLASCQSGN